MSIGTGNGDGTLNASDAEDAGKLYWADKIAPEIMDLTSNEGHKFMKYQVRGKPNYHYYRFE